VVNGDSFQIAASSEVAATESKIKRRAYTEERAAGARRATGAPAPGRRRSLEAGSEQERREVEMPLLLGL
jgi:hypothetical protein